MNRRTVIGSAMAATASVGNAGAQPASGPARPHIVLVHGSWHGGWCWARLVPLLAAAGYSASTPTLTGCGERQHLLSRSITLDTHIQDVVGHIEAEELSGIVLLAHSYGGFVATGVADKLGDRIAHVVLLDAFAPDNGESVADYAGTGRKAMLTEAAERDEGFNIPPIPAAALGVSDPADAAWVNRRMTAQPVGTYLQPIRLARGGFAPVAARTYLSCDTNRLTAFDDTKARIRTTPGWRFAGIDAVHDAMVVSPEILADAVVKAVAT